MLDSFLENEVSGATWRWRLSFLCACISGIILTLALRGWAIGHPLAASVPNNLSPAPGATLSHTFILTAPYTQAKTVTKEWPQKFIFTTKSIKEKKSVNTGMS